MVQYDCGDSTGVYYIIISSLPFKASWQKLKDFIRYPGTGGSINVDHVHIYPNSTDGWVRIHGKEDARKAFEYMNGPTGVFDGRPLQVDDRNRWGPVTLRDEAPIHTSARQEYYASLHQVYSTPSAAGSSHQEHAFTYQQSKDWSNQAESQQGNYSPVSPLYSTGPTVFQTPPMYNRTQCSCANQPVNYGPMSPQQLGYAMCMETPPATPTYQQAIPMAYTGLMQVNVIAASHSPLLPQYQYPTPAQESTRVVHTEARKIIICHLPQSTTEKELQNLLEKAARRSRSRSSSQSEDYPIEYFEIPKYPDGKIKGHAFAVFFSPQIAQRVVDALHGKMMQSKALRVKLTKEGAEPFGGSPSRLEEQREQQLQMYSDPPSTTPQTYQYPLNSAELAAQLGQICLKGPGPPTGYDNTTNSIESRKEKREKGRSGTREKSNDADEEQGRSSKHKSASHTRVPEKDNDTEIERERSSKSKLSSYTRAPVVVDGTGQSGRRRHR
ncbi:hypothetical protein BDZ45DRAFT_753235 [Acephala macrosclerotiorum]|nr:hypothetical protein BDZ45DRAFT_753235 [Acephala macrosclerotiorum]